MKIQLTITLAFLTLFCFGQTQKNTDVVCNLVIPYKPATISILADTGMLLSAINRGNVSKMTYTSMAAGQYKIRISGLGQPTVIRDSIVITKGQNLVLTCTFNGPCLYDHPPNYVPICPRNHTDSIIPIVYGLVVTRGDEFIKNKKEMKVKYAGCVITNCDPQFFCKEHGIEF